ncbi:MAG: carboxymuconolactone decarboxylase family protein [Thermoleophilaceae bacterium]
MTRLPYFDPDTASPDVAEAYSALPALNVFGMVAHAQTAFRPWLRFGSALLTELELDPVLRELSILEGEEDRLGEPERTVVAFTREVVRDVRASDAALHAVREVLSPREVVELLLVVGHYMAVARLAETTGIEVDDPAQLAVVEAAAQRGGRA